MIVIQIILIVGFLFLLVRLLSNPNGHQIRAWTKVGGILFSLLAIGVVLFPESANDVAEFVGVTRGADLLLYLLTLCFIFFVLNVYVKGKQENRQIVQLARKIAILEAELREKSQK